MNFTKYELGVLVDLAESPDGRLYVEGVRGSKMRRRAVDKLIERGFVKWVALGTRHNFVTVEFTDAGRFFADNGGVRAAQAEARAAA